MHQDHGTSPAICQRSIQLGFSSVMIDGSHYDFEKNIYVWISGVGFKGAGESQALFTFRQY